LFFKQIIKCGGLKCEPLKAVIKSRAHMGSLAVKEIFIIINPSLTNRWLLFIELIDFL